MKATAQFGPCYCHVLDGKPHHHVDDCTVVPWDEFCRSFKEYASKTKVTGEVSPDFQLVGFSLVTEDQLVDKHCRISISAKGKDEK